MSCTTTTTTVCFPTSQHPSAITNVDPLLENSAIMIAVEQGDKGDTNSNGIVVLTSKGGGAQLDDMSEVGMLTKIMNNPRGILEQCLYKTEPYIFHRWIVTLALLALYAWRAYITPGYNVVSFGVAVFMLFCLGGFLTPKAFPELHDEYGSEELGTLPITCSDEFKPFARKLPEFDCWFGVTLLLCGATTLTFCGPNDVDLPLFVSILEFSVICIVVIWVCVYNMLKYKYVPFSYGKQTYNGKKTARMGWLKKQCIKFVLRR